MKTQTLDITTPDGACDAFVAYPQENGQYPAVLFLMDAFGLRDHLYDMAKTIASKGFYVLLPNLFYRIRRSPVVDVKFPLRSEDMPEAVKKLKSLFTNYSPDMGIKDIAVFIEFLAKQKQVRPGPIGVTGYCLGGRMAILTAAIYSDRIKAAACFHASNLVTDAPESPHRFLGNIKAELYIAHADNDQNNSPEQIEQFRKALDQAGVKYEAELYSGAPHGFTMADLPAYNEAAMDRHWKKLFALLDRTLFNQ